MIKLAEPYHYRKQGVYYLRVRPQGSLTSTCTVSLRSSERSTAMRTSMSLRATLRTFHLDNPEATWEELRVHIRGIAEGVLNTPTSWEKLDGTSLVYRDLEDDLRQSMATEAFTVDQALGAMMSHRVMMAAGERLRGDPMPLVGIVQELRDPEGSEPIVSQGPVVTEGTLTFRELSRLYLDDQGESLKGSSLKGVSSSCKTLSDLLGSLDMRKHTRADLVNLKGALSENRTASTVNKLLGTLSTVLDWGVNNGYMEKAFAKKLRYTKNADSSRKPFEQDQVKSLMVHADTLPPTNHKKWLLSLGVITGARIGEIHQLTKGDIKNIAGVWCIDINDQGNKELKNKYSARLVPLVDGAYGFNLKEFLEFAEGESQDPLFDVRYTTFCQQANIMVRKCLGLSVGGDQTFHSLRHSLASAMKAESIPVGIAQSILGHSSQSITFDLYGGNQQVGLEKLYDALKVTFG